MKKIIENLHIFSKLAFSLTLLICLIAALYVLYINYENEGKISKKQNNFEQEIKNNISKNSNLINSIVNEIKQNEKTLLEIKNNIVSLSNKNESSDLSVINDNIKLLNKNFNLLSEEINKIKSYNFTSIENNENKSDLINQSKKDIINLILIKYSNNTSFQTELDFLKEIISDSEVKNFEKIDLLASRPFKGFDYLNEIFNTEASIKLKNLINKNPNSLFSKIIFPYMSVSPTTENKITNNLILKIQNIKIEIERKGMENALKQIKTINDYEDIFKITFNEIKNYLDFKNELLRLL